MSLRCCLQFVLGITLAFALVGCAYTDQFSGRAETFGDVAAKARDTMVFTNIIRASRGEPLSFVSIGTINGVSSAQTTVGLPPVIFGPHFTAAQGLANHVMQSQTVFGANAGGGSGFVGNSLNSATSTNFQVTPVETKEFYQGLLHNVDPRILQLFIEQGIARELLFYLFTDRVILTTPTEKTEFRNDPLDPHFERFQHFVKLAMDYGLTSEPRPQQDKPRPEKAGGHEGPESWQLCFSDIYRVKGLPETGDAPRCDGKANSPEERTVQFRTENGRGPIAKLTVLPRSPFGIFQYLGRIAAMGERGHIFLQSAAAVDAPPFRDEILFDIVSAAPGEAIDGGCYLDLTFNGATYCVPNRAINTKRIFGLLTQLIALNTALGDVPVTPTVRVVQ